MDSTYGLKVWTHLCQDLLAGVCVQSFESPPQSLHAAVNVSDGAPGVQDLTASQSHSVKSILTGPQCLAEASFSLVSICYHEKPESFQKKQSFMSKLENQAEMGNFFE